MGRFATKSDIKVVAAPWWEEGETCTIKRWSIREKDRLDSKILSIAGAAGEIPEVVIKNVTVPYLEAGILEWSLLGEDGNVAPLNPEMIGQLLEEDADFIAREIRAFNEGRAAEDQQDFLRPSEGSAEIEGESSE